MAYEDRPNRIPWPPLLFAGAALLALVAHWNHPIPFPTTFAGSLLRVLGAAFIAAAIAVDLMAFTAFRRHRTTILPHRGAEHLITTGIFRWSRNPIYIGNVLLLTGVGLAAGIWTMVIAAPFALLATRQLAVLREEKHLARRFGAQWQDYSRKTRRWL
jgi:protein-S-isoprenylcysteine O-methyltransferase Ste14